MTGPWKSIRNQPKPTRPYLVSATYGGIRTCNVAFYNGKRADGSPWWAMSDIEIPQLAIDHYAELRPPE
ncbi:hypothetical protein Brsp01_32200 [Brucella sp. NBRC 12950]|nr:hypothetical protein Brsp01_32200 [Brucella sp. NBRC 12950]